MCAMTRVARPSGDRARPVPVVARAYCRIVGADVADQVAGVVGPHVVDEGLQFAGTHRPHRVLLAARPVGPQQLLQQVFRWSRGRVAPSGSLPSLANRSDGDSAAGAERFAGLSEVVAAGVPMS